MSIGGVLRRGGVAGPDRPDGFVSDYDFCELSILKRPKGAPKLLSQHGFGVLLFALSNADDRDKSRVERCYGFLQHTLVAFAKILTAFAVTDNHVRATGRPDPGPGNFTGKGTLLCPVQILRADLYARSASRSDRSNQVQERRTDYDLAMSGVLDQRTKRLEERHSSSAVLV